MIHRKPQFNATLFVHLNNLYIVYTLKIEIKAVFYVLFIEYCFYYECDTKNENISNKNVTTFKYSVCGN